MIFANDFCCATDSETLEKMMEARGEDGIVVIGPRCSLVEPERKYWLIDRAILIPENTTVVLQNATIKLSDSCRDNFFRTANCGLGIETPSEIHNVHLRGEGLCVLQGADRPRATGDGSKVLSCPCPYSEGKPYEESDWLPKKRSAEEQKDFLARHAISYGTDALRPEESHKGDWRGIGVLFANAVNFSVSGIKIVDPHGWSISLEACSYGRVENIEFDAKMRKLIDGAWCNMENQDGLDLRNGCHHITVTNITGRTGDDVVALTAIAGRQYKPGGSLCTTHVMHNDWTKRDPDIHDIVIRNVVGYSNLCYVLRLLAADARIYNVVADGIIDCPPENHVHSGTVIIGADGYGTDREDALSGIILKNVICKSRRGVYLAGHINDSVIRDVINHNPATQTPVIGGDCVLKNVTVETIINAQVQSGDRSLY